MKKFLPQIISEYTIALVLFIAPLNILIANNKQGSPDETLQKKVNNWMMQSALGFEENKGQFADDKGKPVPDLLFKTSAKGMDMYITTSGITYLFTKRTKITEDNSGEEEDKQGPEEMVRRIQRSRVDMILSGASIKKENTAMEYPLEQGSLNYYSGHCPKGILGVQTYRKITIKSIYPGIDWVLYTQGNEGLKYDFIVHPGADPQRIKMCYKGAENIEKSDDETLKITTRLGEIKEGKLVSYEEGSRKEVKSFYKIHRTTSNTDVSFDISSYDLSQNLIIDPPLLWATYYGGTANDGPHDITTDASGNVYATGYTSGSVIDLPLEPLDGAYYQDTTISPNNTFWDTFILKFNASGVRQWATLYGGRGTEYGNGIAVDKMGNLYMRGSTNSSDFPLHDPGGSAYFDGTRSASDIFILKFNSFGVRTWATLFGGSSDELISIGKPGQLLAVDQGGNVYITGTTQSNDFPTRNPGGGAYLQTYAAGLGVSSDVIIAKFNSSNSLVWSTCYGGLGNGGLGNEEGTAIITDLFGNVFVTGNTNSSDFPTFIPSGAYSQLYGGGAFRDAFILKFDTAGVRLWATYYGGADDDGGRDIVTDLAGNVYVIGNTSSANLPILNPGGGAYFQDIGGGSSLNADAFILKFNNSGVHKWATYYGGLQGAEQGYSITTDISGNIYATGSTTAVDFPFSNPGPCFYFNNVNRGIYIQQFDTSGVLKWATCYASGWGAGIATDNSGNIYVTGEVTSIMDTLNPGGGAYYQSVHGGGSDDGYILKFGSSLKAIFDHPTVCLNDTAFFTDRSKGNPTSWSWNFDDPVSGGANTSDQQNPSHVFSAPGTYNVKLVASTCISDSIIIPVTVYPLPAAEAGSNVDICRGDSVTLTASDGVTYAWSPSTGLNSVTDNTVQAGPSSSTTYIVTVTDTNSCENKDSVTVTVHPLPVVNISPDVSICMGDSTTLSASPGGVSYSWSPSTGLNNTTANSVKASPSVTTAYTVTITDVNGCVNKDSVIVTVNPLPVANAGPDVTLCPGELTVLTASGGVAYSWSPQTGLSATAGSSVNANPAATTTYIVVVTDVNGCTDSDTITVTRLDVTTATSSSTPANCSSNDGSATVTPDGVNAPYTYSWFPGGVSTATASNLAAGTYICTITDAGGCANDFNVTVDNLSGFSGSLVSHNNVSCNGGNDGAATVAGSGGTQPYSYVWSTSPPQNGATATGIAAGYYSCTISDADNCTFLVAVAITEPAPLVLITSSTPDVCRNSNGSASVIASGGTSPYSYSWDASSDETPDIYNLSAGNYAVTVTDNNGCTATASINVPIDGLLTLNTDKVIQAGCSGSCSGSIEVTANGTPPYAFTWNT